MKKSVLALIMALAVTCWTGSAQAFLYAVDDGSSENSIGLTGATAPLIWMNHFYQTSGATTITSVLVAWGQVPDGTPATISIWGDPTGTGNPGSSTLLYSTAVTVANNSTDIFNIYNVLPTVVPVSFFVGIEMVSGDGSYPASIDQSPSQQSSWIASPEIGLPFDLIDNYGYPGNWLIRAEASSGAVPEPSTVILFAAGLGGLACLRRYRR